MRKAYLINLSGKLQDRLEKECSKGIFNYTTIMRLALADFFDELDREKEKRQFYGKNDEDRSGS